MAGFVMVYEIFFPSGQGTTGTYALRFCMYSTSISRPIVHFGLVKRARIQSHSVLLYWMKARRSLYSLHRTFKFQASHRILIPSLNECAVCRVPSFLAPSDSGVETPHLFVIKTATPLDAAKGNEPVKDPGARK
jgi:hypothetical protein